MIFDVFSSGPMCRSSGRPFVAMCSIVLADLKSVGLLAMVEVGLVTLLATRFGPPVQAVALLPPPIRGLGMPVPAGAPTPVAAAVAATAAAAAVAATAAAARVLILRVV